MDDDELDPQQSAAYELAFNSELTETPAADVVKAAPQEPEPEPQPEYVQITREDYDRFRQVAAKLPELEQSFGKRVDTAFGKIGVIEQGLKQGGGALSEEDLASFKDDLPEIYQAFAKLRAPTNVESLLEERTKPYAERLDRVTAELRETQQATVAAAHPDWAEFAGSPEYSAWRSTKDQAFLEKLDNTWAPRTIIGAISEAKAFAQKAKAPPPAPPKSTSRQAIVQAAQQPRGTGGRYIPSQATEEEAYANAWK